MRPDPVGFTPDPENPPVVIETGALAGSVLVILLGLALYFMPTWAGLLTLRM